MKNLSGTAKIQQIATNRIIKMLEDSVNPWRKPWSNYGFAKNHFSGKPYTGINALFLNCVASRSIPYYATFKQISGAGGKVNKGAKSETVYYYGSSKKTNKETGEIEAYKFLKFYRVFNLEDTTGVKYELPEQLANQHERIESCEKIIKKTGAIITHNEARAYYNRGSDKINMPELNLFEHVEGYYDTLFHELIHWTGHTKRLNREDLNNSLGMRSKSYAREELVAELGAAMLCASFGLERKEVLENQAAYLQSWINALKSDSNILFAAAPKAQKAMEFVLK